MRHVFGKASLCLEVSLAADFQRGMKLAVDPTFFDLLASSYSRLVGAPLVPLEHDNQYAARWLYEEAPFCVLAHNTDRDPIFIYGNKAAQACLEYTWDELLPFDPTCLRKNPIEKSANASLMPSSAMVLPPATADCGLPNPEDASGSRT
jgi:hypothetical protein